MLSRRTVLKTVAAGAGLMAVRAPRAWAWQEGTLLTDVAGGSALAQGLGSADLGIPYYRAHDGTWGYVFGDSWSGLHQSGTYLGSPVMLTQNRFDSTGAVQLPAFRQQRLRVRGQPYPE